MSYLSLPRIHFQGEFVANVATANNDDVVRFVDVARVTVDTNGKTDDELRQWLEEYQEGTPGRTEGIRAGWNYHGDNSCRFEQVAVTCAELSEGTVASPTDDPLVGATVLLRDAVMVDLNPEGSLGTQIFCERLEVRGSGGMFWEGPLTRSYSRWLWFQRNLRARGFKGASAIWLAAMRGDELRFGAASSPALRALRAASEAGAGLVIRFCTYFLEPRIGEKELAERLKDRPVANPARGRVIGTIGPLQAGELTSAVSGRRLHPLGSLTDEHVDYRLGPAVARVDRDRRVVSLDLITAFPERNETLEKVNVGPVSLGLRHRQHGREEMLVLGPVAYDRATYEATAGVVDVPYPAEAEPLLESGDLLLVRDGSEADLLSEAESVVETDDRAVYLQEGETRALQLRATRRGHPAEAGSRVRIEEYDTTNIKGFPGTPASPAARVVEIPEETTVGGDGTASLTLRARRPGSCVIRFVPLEAAPGRFNPTTDFFTSVRVLPADDYDHLPDEQLTHDFVYREVLRYYHLVHPAMSRFINWSDEESVRAKAGLILERISKDRWHHYDYMPRTRELSDGKRKLLQRWCRLQQGR